ncbi:MAG: metallophosphoesterase [Candidatus Heimdallarchaeum aukensis]|uniref:Metallophosphoesterase n=2 Tax=Candidatus Heimdallarchaeum aukensis TaxID=2876573 RepID=A0A9Y1BLY8_9ARCH|nr:MAG: metallophosphoesterase [Candidatus Heimdallarchaeum aukensis]
MVKIAHMSDTHLSHRRVRNVRDSWKERYRVSWIENDFSLAFQRALDAAIETKCDFLVHSGDLFDVPVKRNTTSPSEYARAIAISEIRRFLEATHFKVPIIIIDGNHGTYLYRNNSTIEFIKSAFPENVFIATNYDLKRAIVKNEPLKVEFEEINFYLFPYLEFKSMANYEELYDEWISKCQEPEDGKINVAVAHGMFRNLDLHEKLFSFPYDYVALGHDHQQRKYAPNAWQAGSTEKYTFAERGQEKGILEVIIEKGKNLHINPIKVVSQREMKQFEVELSSDMSALTVEEKIRELVASYRKNFDGNTAARIKVKLQGKTSLSYWWTIEDRLVEIQKNVLTEEYNILEFRWDEEELKKSIPQSLAKTPQMDQYLIEDPVRDFVNYLKNLEIDDEVKFEQYAKLGPEIIKEVFSEGFISSKEELE